MAVPVKKKKYKRLGLKLFSLVLAVLIWGFVSDLVRERPITYKDIKDIDIRLMGEPLVLGKNAFSFDLDRRTVDIRVKGPAAQIEQLSRADIFAYVDVSNLRPGRTYAPVLNFILPAAIELVGAPPLVRVEIKETNFK